MGSHPWVWKLAVFLLLCPLFLGQQCPADSIVTVSSSCRGLEAASPPQGDHLAASPPPLVTTSSGLFDWWYTIPNLIVATTQAQPFPRDIVNDATEILVQQKYLKNSDFESFQPSYLPWSTPIILVTCTGVLIGLLFLMVGCCLCLCSCLCKFRKETAYRPKVVARQNFRWCIWWNSISLISGVFLLFGFVMAIACVITFNEATYSLPRALQQSTSTIVGYLNATKQEFGSQLSSGLDQTADCINGQVNDIPAAVGEAVLSGFELREHTESVAMDCLELLSITEKTNASAQSLLQHLQSLVAELGTISQLSGELLNNCTADRLVSRCGALQDIRDNLTVNSMQPPDLAGNATLLQNYLAMEVKPSLNQVRDIVANTSAAIASAIDSEIGDTVETAALNMLKAQSQNKSVSFAGILDDASQLTMDVLGWMESLLSVAPSSITSDAPDRSTLSLLLSVYNYGYLIGVFFCVLFGLMLVALVICLILGCLAYERIPQTRDRKAQHMKRCFRLLIFCIFIIAFVSIALASFGYFVAANVHEVCEELRGPEYSAFDQTLDDPQWRQSNLLQMLRSPNARAFFQPILASNISSSIVLSQCFGGGTSWQVFDLVDILNSTSDLSLNFITEALSSSIEAQQTPLASAVPTALSELNNPGPATDLASAVGNLSQLIALQQPLEYEQFLASVEAVLTVASSVQGQVGSLTALMSVVNASDQTSLREGLGALIQEIGEIEALAAGVEEQVVLLMNLSVSFPVANTRIQESLNRLSNSANMFLADLNNDTAKSLTSAMEAVMCRFGQVGNYSRAAEDLIYYNTSSCYPLWEAYSTAYTATCVNLLGSLNGLWFAMGWCVLGLIPLLVGLLGVQSHFVKARLPDRRSTSNVTAHLTKNKPVALVSHSARQQTLPSVESHLVGIELDVVQNAWTGEVIPLPRDGDCTEEHYVNANLNVPHGSGYVAHNDPSVTRVDAQGESRQTLPWAEVHQNENTLITQPPPSYEQLI